MKKILFIIALTVSVFSSEKDLALDAMAFSSNNTNKSILIITDPECPFCKKLAKDKNNKLKEYKINYVLVALPYHKEAKQMISYILSAKTNDEKYHRYIEIMIGDDISYKEYPTDVELVEKYLKKSMKLVKQLGINSVPKLFEPEENEFFETTYEEM